MKYGNFKKRLLFILCMVLSVSTFAQSRVISGKVTDSKGETLPGVSVLIQGTTNGVATDMDGKFSLKAENGNVLVFSFIGYKTQSIKIEGQTTLNVIMKDDIASLDEVVVIGYGQQRKGDATGSIATVGEDVFNKGAISTPQELIMGKTPGVVVTTGSGAPGSGATIRIRGGSSLSASNDPLIVIDGVPVDNDDISGVDNPLSLVNPNDIATMTILKDASATAIYGSRASNGVILITTKSGSKNKKIELYYTGKFYINTLAKKIDVMNADQFRTMALDKFGDRPDTETILDMFPGVDNNWQDHIFQNGFGQDHSIGIGGNVLNTPYRFSYGYTNEDGTLKTSNLKRHTLNLSTTPTFFDDHLKISLNAKGMFTKQRFADKGAIGQALAFDPTKPVYAEGYEDFGGFFAWTTKDKDGNFLPNNQGTRNPVATLELKNDHSDVKRFVGSAAIDYKFHFLPDLRVNLNLGLDYSKSDGNTDEDIHAAWTRIDPALGYGYFKTYKQEKRNKLLEVYLNYNKEIPSIKSRIDVMAGHSYQNFWRKGSDYAYALNSNDLTTRIERTNKNYESEYTLISFYGRLNYTLMDRYMLTFTMRGDGSSRFAEGNRWGAFPSVALGWRINEESFMKDFSQLSNLKLRLGYGITGQQDIVDNDFPYMPRYTWSDDKTQYPFGSGYISTLRPDGYDKNIKWEKTTTYNAGVDVGFYNNRINGTFDFYKRKTDDLINYVPVPAGSNMTNKVTTNVGSLENTGIEIGLDFVPVQTKNWNWSIGVNAAYNKNKITKLTLNDDPDYVGVPTGNIDGGTGNMIQMNSVGHALEAFYVFEQVYDENGKPIEGLFVDRNGDGKINNDDKYHYKKASPDWTLGFNTALRYKSWDLSLSGRASLGNYAYNNVQSSRAQYNNVYYLGYLSNLPTSIDKTHFTGSNEVYFSDYYVQDAKFLKIDNITLGYTFDNIWRSRLGIRLYFTTQNVCTITNYKGLDPEVFGGLDYNFYPRPRTFLFGLNVNF